MKHSVDDLLGVVYRYYPRHVDRQEPRYEQSEEYHRLKAARRQAGAGNEKARWYAMLERVQQQFPSDSVQNDSLHLPTGEHDAGYSGKVFLPTSLGEHFHIMHFLVSFLAPCYSLFTARVVDDEPDPEFAARAAQFPTVFIGNTCYCVPADHPLAAYAEPPPPYQPRRTLHSFEFSLDEQPYATKLAQDIESLWGCEPLLPDVGQIIVPDVATNCRSLGEATLFDCLLSER